MEFAVNVPTSSGGSEYTMLAFSDTIHWEDELEFTKAVERFGFDGVAVPDHLMTGDGATMECLTVLGALARETEDVYLYPKTLNDTLRHGPYLAKAVASLDNVSEGRMKVGMGGGWKRDEAEAYGYDWPSAPDRLRAMEETIELMTRLWTEQTVTHDGEYYSVDEAECTPHPVQSPRPPIMVGGGGEEFTLRIAAKHADCWNYWGTVDVMERKLDVLERHCETYDRDFEEIQTSWFARCVVRETEDEVDALLDEVPRFREENLDDDENHLVGTPKDVVEEISRYAELGISEVVVEFVDFPETTGMELFAEQVLPEFR